jgi:hypothetical protein
MLDFLDVLETKRVDFHENELSHFCANRIFFGIGHHQMGDLGAFL